MSSICINVAAKVAVNRPAAVTHSRLVRTAAADGKVKPATAIIAAYHFRFERKLVEVEPRILPRSTCKRTRLETQ